MDLLDDLERLGGDVAAGIYGFEYLEDLEDGWVADEEAAVRIRRPYRFMTRVGLDTWDDIDFLQRFRLMKATVLKVLTIIEERLVFVGDGR